MRRPLIAIACALLLGGYMNTAAGFIGNSLGVPLRKKVVRSKKEPNILITTDATTCQVSKNRWEEAESAGRSCACGPAP